MLTGHRIFPPWKIWIALTPITYSAAFSVAVIQNWVAIADKLIVILEIVLGIVWGLIVLIRELGSPTIEK